MMLDSIKGREPYQRMKERAQDRQGCRVITRYETCWTAVQYRERDRTHDISLLFSKCIQSIYAVKKGHSFVRNEGFKVK